MRENLRTGNNILPSGASTLHSFRRVVGDEMECAWDDALLELGDQLPPELLDIIQNGSNDEYLGALVTASLDARYTHLIFARCHPVFAHICAALREHGTLAASLATIARILPFAEYLAPFATHLLESEAFNHTNAGPDELLLYLLGVFRLLRFDPKTFRQVSSMDRMYSLLRHENRPAVYLAIRILQIGLDGSDAWFEEMVREYLGSDTPESGIDGMWDDRVIDYRFLTLWEEQRYEKMSKLLESARSTNSDLSANRRILTDSLHRDTVLIGSVLLPRLSDARPTSSDGLVLTSSIAQNLNRLSMALMSTSPVLLSGLPGSGKTLLVRHAAERLGKLDKMVTLHLNEQSDAKLMIGIYTTGDTPGSFVWKPGVLTTAVEEGRWILIEDLDRAPQEILGTLLPLIERRELFVSNRKQTVLAAPGFKILATVRSNINHRGQQTQPLGHMIGARHWQTVAIDMPTTTELQDVVTSLFPKLGQLLPQFVSVYERLAASRQRAVLIGHSKAGVLRSGSARDLLKWCRRTVKLLEQRPSFSSADLDDIFLEAIDCFAGSLPDGQAREDIAAIIAEEMHIDLQRRDYLLGDREVNYEVGTSQINVGRYTLPRTVAQRAAASTPSTFSANAHTARMLERAAAAVINSEPLLLVGETGVGKTTAVQQLADRLGKKLQAFNLSQQSEAGDLLGGFKPVTARSLMIPMKDEFDELFAASFSMSKNQQFMALLGKHITKSNWKAVCKLWHQALKMVDQQRAASPSRQGEAPSKKRKVEAKKHVDFVRWAAFANKVVDMERRLAAGDDSFAFSFVEGNIVRALRNGDWVLLDEMNLASPDTLEALADLFDSNSPSILLAEAGNVERIHAHPDFRLFAAMNPATDVGKKDLPPGIRTRFTELYVESPDKDVKSLRSIVRSYLRTEAASDPALALDVSTLYQKIIALGEQNKLVDGAGQNPHFSLRTLTRTLSYAKYMAPQCDLRRALYEGFQMSFLTFLDADSAQQVQPLLERHLFGKRTNLRAELKKALRKPNDGRTYIQPFPGTKHWARQGSRAPEEQAHYILTPFIKANLENLVRASSTRQFPVLIQGPTSSGKTSMVEYLAKRTGHKFVRINNHEHTDLQEYLGTYISGSDGRLQFVEGVLVQALREGHWIVLDELNLAPTDVLEALNRLLDDNRELLIPETQEVVRPHEDFMLFATQNPAGLYGGRKALSRAFRNRFLELHFNDIPLDELLEILHRRSNLPESRCRRIMAAYQKMSVLRQENRLFEEKSFATLRDLFRWAMRPNDTIQELAANGFMLLAERVRKPEERAALKSVIERVMSANGPRVTLDEKALYAQQAPEVSAFEAAAPESGVIWTKAMRRLYVLVSRAIQNNEPVLLVGETGCGKTTVCQMLAAALGKQLHTVNAHQSTETGDLIGSQRPVRNRAAIEEELRRCLIASPALASLEIAAGLSTDDLLLAYDQAIAALSSGDRSRCCTSSIHTQIDVLRGRYKALFEWVDGNLVTAMKRGELFLLDEISLADDSVLERLNSVLESQRSLLLAEKGSVDTFISATDGFQFFATMNPGGDYGKRELSPALRNRFTEIWVPSVSDEEDITQIVQAKLKPEARTYAQAIVAFAQWFKDRYNTSASASVSIRDVLALVQFINLSTLPDSASKVVHGGAMVYIDTLGANPAGLRTLSTGSLVDERLACLTQLSSLLGVSAAAIYGASTDVRKTDTTFGIGPFSVPSRASFRDVQTTFTFEARTTRLNAMRVLRAMQLPKPIMLEGSPGVGKTALVTAIAVAAGVPLTRINLSEQTDLMDLFGSDAPVQGAATGTFAWRDAPFLRAMKTGEWVLLDEMNLASQSVLEGLNACLDHRGEVFIPELGHTFVKHPDFRLFAAQNPHHQGGGRKGLPASFVNRFTVVYADAFQADDLRLICQRSLSGSSAVDTAKIIEFTSRLQAEVVDRRRFGANGGPWEFNLRDVSRWLRLATVKNSLLTAASDRDLVRMLFAQRFRTAVDQQGVDEIFKVVFGDEVKASELFHSLSPTSIQLGLGLLPRNPLSATQPSIKHRKHLATAQLRTLESLMICVGQQWPVILTGPSGCGKTFLLEGLAASTGAHLTMISLNAETDAMDLIGGFEQADSLRQVTERLEHLRLHLQDLVKQQLAASMSSHLKELVSWPSLTLQNVLAHRGLLQDALKGSAAERVLADLLHATESSKPLIDKARFEWVDGLLIEALHQGHWLVLDNANLCSPSVLDRLNSLLEPHGVLIVNENTTADGWPRVIAPHPDFRIFLTTDPRYGELSRAMRNRAVELFMGQHEGATRALHPLAPESTMSRFRQAEVLGWRDGSLDGQQLALGRLPHDHLGLADRSLRSRFCVQLSAGLYNTPVAAQLLAADSSVEDSQPLADFYKSAISHAEASADFARAQVSDSAFPVSADADGKGIFQTLHPLNNQPLVQQDHQTFAQASTLALKHDTSALMSLSLYDFRRLSQDPAFSRRLEGILRTLEGGRQRSSDVFANTIETLAKACLDWVSAHTLSPHDGALWARSVSIGPQLRQLMRTLAGYLSQFGLTVLPKHGPEYLRAWVSALASSTQALCSQAPELAPLSRQISAVLQDYSPLGDSPVDSACATLWKALKPSTPGNQEQLNSVLELENIVERFDGLSLQSGYSTLDDLATTRCAFARALQAASTGSADASALLGELSALIPDAVEADASVHTLPHFEVCFKQLCGHMAALSLAGYTLKQDEVCMTELLAGVSILDSILDSSKVATSTQNDFRLLSAVVPHGSASDPNQNVVNAAMSRLQSTQQVCLRALPLLNCEVKALGRTIAGVAHAFDSPMEEHLKGCFKRLVIAILSAFEASSHDALQQFGQFEMARLTGTRGSEGHFELASLGSRQQLTDALSAIHAAVDYFVKMSSPDASMITPSAAWSSFAVGCLSIYLPFNYYDPALQPQVMCEVHAAIRSSIDTELSALRTYQTWLNGDSGSLRTDTLNDELAQLGSAPEVQQIFRPDTSRLVELQNDFAALLRELPALRGGACRSLKEDPLVWSKLDVLRSRLRTQYPSYRDLTGPALGFIDCLRVARHFSLDRGGNTSRNTAPAIIPFAGASPSSWLEDAAFVAVLSRRGSLDHAVHALQVLAARCQIMPLRHQSPEMQRTVDDCFAAFYSDWARRLRQEQRQAASKSSLYRYQGGDDGGDEDEALVKELEELFPSTSPASIRDNPPVAEGSEYGALIADTYHAIYRSGSPGDAAILALLDSSHAKVEAESSTSEHHNALPALMWNIEQLGLRLAAAKPTQLYNIYTDENTQQARNLLLLLTRIRARFVGLHDAWPEHATPMEVLRSCESIVQLSFREPLMRYLPGLEQLRNSVAQWQDVASREYSVADLLDEVTSMIVSWRRLELSSWAAMLAQEDRSCQAQAKSWWFIAYESIIAAGQSSQAVATGGLEHIEALLKTLEAFVSACGVGEFSPRLEILRDFEAHLAISTSQDAPLKALSDALAHFIAYYSRYEPTVEELLRKSRGDLEKELRDVIQLASWKDRNVEVLKQSAASSRKKLLQVVRKYRKLLAQPVLSALSADVQRLTSSIIATSRLPLDGPEAFKELLAPSESMFPLGWRHRPARFRNATTTAGMVLQMAQVSSRDTATERLHTFLVELMEEVSTLQKATPNILTDDNKTVVQDLKRRKRRLLADVLRALQGMGFQRSMSDDIRAKQTEVCRILASSPSLASGYQSETIFEAEDWFHRLLSKLPELRESARKHSDDLTAPEAARCMTLLESMVHVAVSQRARISEHSKAMIALTTILQQFDSFAKTRSPVVNTPRQHIDRLLPQLQLILTIIGIASSLVQSQSALADLEAGELLELLHSSRAEVTELFGRLNARPILPYGVSDVDSVALQNQVFQVLHSLAAQLHQKLENQPQFAPTILQLCEWLTAVGKQPTPINGNSTRRSTESYAAQLTEIVDGVLASIQDFKSVSTTRTTAEDDKAWLVQKKALCDRKLASLRMGSLTLKVASLLSSLHDCGNDSALASVAAICGSVLPILQAYATVCADAMQRAVGLHSQAVRMAHQLANIFLQLAQRGFCTPPEKEESQDQSAGNVEAGTGLGEGGGEGAEDISKDIGDDEDLGDLPNEPQISKDDGDMKNEADAVDMADQDLEGQIGDQPEDAEQEGHGDEGDAEDGIDEEKGSVDGSDPAAVDEKIWDEGGVDEGQEKETNDAKGKSSEDDNVASREDKSNEQFGEMEAEDEAALEAPDEEDRVKQQGTDQIDPHAADEETLELPEDINVDGKDGDDADDVSDIGSVEADDAEDLGDGGDEVDHRAEDVGEAGGQDAEELEDEDPEAERTGEGQETEEDGVDREEDRDSDVLMTEYQPDTAAGAEENQAAAESGSGGNDDEASANQAKGLTAADEERKEGENAENLDQTAAAGGAQPNDSERQEPSRANDIFDDQSRLPFKQLGEVLDRWYRQHGKIDEAQEEHSSQAPQDMDMANARFEHLPNAEVEADTQALGAASADQSTALDEEQGLPVNEDLESALPPPEQGEDMSTEENVGAAADIMQVDAGDIPRKDQQSNAFIGEPQSSDVDLDIPDAMETENEGHLNDVDRQLTATHLSLSPSTEMSLEEARKAWFDHEASTRNLALILTEHLRLVLHPTQATKMRGDFRTGKRLNIKRIIPYIASSYRRDKIWMRRAVPSKRSYQIMLAMDDSRSMAESESKDLAFDTVALVAKAMSMLEVGELSVVGFGEHVNIAHEFSAPWTAEAGAQVFRQFSFAQSGTDVRKLLAESIEIFRSARLKAAGSASDLWQLQLIVSDGVCQDHPSIRQLVRQAHEEKIMVVFIVVDATAPVVSSEGGSGPNQSILDLQTAEFVKDDQGEMQLKMVKYLDTFPFKYYVIVRDVKDLPAVLAGALRQWFAEVVEMG